jgi:hypothetical protein
LDYLGLVSDAARPSGLEIGIGPPETRLPLVDHSWQGPRPVFLAQNAQTATATGIPVEKAKPVLQKTPLQQPTSEEIREQQTIAKTSAPASTLSF